MKIFQGCWIFYCEWRPITTLILFLCRESVWEDFGSLKSHWTSLKRRWSKWYIYLIVGCFRDDTMKLKLGRSEKKEAKTQRSFTPTFSPKMIDRIIQLRLFVLFAVDSEFRLYYNFCKGFKWQAIFVEKLERSILNRLISGVDKLHSFNKYY